MNLIKLCQKANFQLNEDILQLIISKSYKLSPLIFLSKISQFSFQGQKNFFILLSKSSNEEIREILLSLFPPWTFGIDCILLSSFLSTFKLSSFDLYQILQITILTPPIDELKSAFISENLHFPNFIINLFKLFDDYEKLTPLLDRLIEVLIQCPSCIYVFTSICDILEPVLYAESLINHIEELGKIESFLTSFSLQLSSKISLRTELKVKQIVAATWE